MSVLLRDTTSSVLVTQKTPLVAKGDCQRGRTVMVRGNMLPHLLQTKAVAELEHSFVRSVAILSAYAVTD